MRHFEILVEDASGAIAVNEILANHRVENVTFKIHSYKGVGRVPKGLRPGSDPKKRILLDQIPRLMAGYGKTFAHDAPEFKRSVIVVCDVDSRDPNIFGTEIRAVLSACSPCPDYKICFAIEEGEAWLLGDTEAVLLAYPGVSRSDLARYQPDSICGTWEFLANLVERGGAKALKAAGFQAIGAAKAKWARDISPHVQADRSRSPSFLAFIQAISSS